MIKYLYTPTVLRISRPVLMGLSQLNNQQGFRSVFGFPEETARVITKQGNLKDISHLPVHCDTIFVDFDNNQDAAMRCRDMLRQIGVGYKMFDSGNRSIHFHIPIKPIEGAWVPRAVYEHVEKYIPGCDMTIYRHASLFRLAGTWHEKNPGNWKRVLEMEVGEDWVVEKPKQEYKPTRASDDSGVPLDMILKKRVDSGGRRCYVFTIGSVCHKRNIPMQKALEFASVWNKECANPPLEYEIICQKIQEAYR